MSPDAIAADSPTGQRTLHDSRGNSLEVRWRASAEKVLVHMDYLDPHGRIYWTSSAELTERLPRWAFTVPPAGNRQGKIELTAEGDQLVLGGDLPVSAYGSFREELARWARPSVSIPAPGEPEAVEEIPDSDSPLRTVPGCGWKPAGSIIQNPACPQELLRILSVRPPAPPPLGGQLLGFVILLHPEELPLYQELAKLRTEPDGWSKMIAAAVQFAAQDPAFVQSLASLDTPASAYPFLVSQIRGLQGEVSLDVVVQTVDTFLFAFGTGPLQDYLESDYLKGIEQRVWQSLFAVSLGATARPALPDGLIEVLQVDHFLRELQRERLESPPHPLTQPQGREEVLGATVLLPPGAVPVEPACLEEPPPLETGWVKALGVGDLKLIYQCLKGYGLGEVAHVVNVMERERLELSARELTRREEIDETQATDATGRDEQEERLSLSDLRNELEDVVATEALCSQFNNLTQTYNGTQMTLAGGWQGSDGVQERSDREARQLAESLTRRAASRVARTVTELRVRRRLREEERVDARDIDNREGTGNLVGIYRWLHKIYEMAVRDEGKRLVVEFEIADPAAELLLHIQSLHGVPLARPQPPEHYKVYSWQDVTPENYLVLAGLYQTEVPPPPPAEIGLIRSFQSQPPLFQADLEIPEGYGVTAGTVRYLLGDVSDNLVGYVGTAQFSYTSTPATGIPGLLETPAPPAGSGGGTGCPALTDPFTYLQVPFQPVQGQADLSLPGAAGKIPAAMLSTAAWFSATVALTCGLPAGSELMQAWQIRTYDALVAAYLRCLERYEATVRERIGAACDADRRRIEQRQLQLRAFQILWSRRAPGPEASPPTGPSSGSPPCAPGARYLELFEHAFAWNEMTYAFHTWPPPAEPCGPTPGWRGQALLYSEADGLFDSFLHARSARVLVPVRPGFAAAVLFYLHFGLPWPGTPLAAPAAETDLPVLADLRTPPAPAEDGGCASWQVEVPTSMLVLQPGGELPTFPCPLETTP